MAKKSAKFFKKYRKPLVKFGLPAGLVLIGLVLGLAGSSVWQGHDKPKNLVWAADQTVKLPSDLKTYLLKRDDCKNYRGPGTVTGVGLWGVYQVEKDQFAKIAYGCSWALASYMMAVRQNGHWLLVPPSEYFAASDPGARPGSNSLPKCSQLSRYKISKVIEPFCIDNANQAQLNSLP